MCRRKLGKIWRGIAEFFIHRQDESRIIELQEQIEGENACDSEQAHPCGIDGFNVPVRHDR